MNKNILRNIFLVNLFLFSPLFFILGFILLRENSNNLFLKIIILILAIYIFLLSCYKIFFVSKKIHLKIPLNKNTGVILILIGIIFFIFSLYKLNEIN